MSTAEHYLDELATFVRVAEAGSIQGAARLLGVPKSTVSRRVSRLEGHLDVRLLQRSSRTLRLTEEGRALFARARRPIAELLEATDWVGDAKEALRGRIRITAPQDFGRSRLGPLLASFVKAHPDVQIEAELTNRYADVIQEGFDLAIRAGRLRDSALIARPLLQTSLQLAASPAWCEAHGPFRRLQDLEAMPFVIFRPTARKAGWKFRGPKGDVVLNPRAVIEAKDFAFVERLVALGTGVGILPDFLLQEGLETKSIVHLFPRYETPHDRIHLLYPSSRHVPPRVAALRDHLMAGFGGRGAK